MFPECGNWVPCQLDYAKPHFSKFCSSMVLIRVSHQMPGFGRWKWNCSHFVAHIHCHWSACSLTSFTWGIAGSAITPPSSRDSSSFSTAWAGVCVQFPDKGLQALQDIYTTKVRAVRIDRFCLTFMPALPHLISVFLSWLPALWTWKSSINTKTTTLQRLLN